MERKRGVDGRFVSGRRVRERLVEVLANPASDSMDEEALAKKVGIRAEVLDEVFDESVVKEAMARRVEEIHPDELAEVDRAMLARAKEGHVGAARLLYARMEGRKNGLEDFELPTLEELEEELKSLGRLPRS